MTAPSLAKLLNASRRGVPTDSKAGGEVNFVDPRPRAQPAIDDHCPQFGGDAVANIWSLQTMSERLHTVYNS